MPRLLRFFAIALLGLAVSAATAQPLQKIADSLTLQPGESHTLTFNATPELIAKRPALSLLARLQADHLDGSTFCLQLRLNGTVLDDKRLLNKLPDTQMYSGQILPWYGRASFRAVYSPDYEAANRGDTPTALVGGHAYDFVLAAADLLKPGENTLVLTHIEKTISNPLVLADIALVPAPKPPRTLTDVGQPPPTGKLPIIEPKPVKPIAYDVKVLPGGSFAITCGQARAVLRSSFSYPNVGWNVLGEGKATGQEEGWHPVSMGGGRSRRVQAEGRYYRLERRVRLLSDHVEVSDRLTNLTNQDLHISVRDSIEYQAANHPQITIRGLHLLLPRGYDRGGDNPTVLVSRDGCGFGIVAEDDVLRVQTGLTADPDLGEAGLLDHYFMLQPGAAYALRWSVYVVPGGDYFDFVNAVRRNWGTNFTIPGPFAFVPTYPSQQEGLDFGQWLHDTTAKIVSLSIPRPRDNILAHGLAFLKEPEEQQRLKGLADKLRSLDPGLKVLQYLHTYITWSKEPLQQYRDAWLLGPDGKQRTYRAGVWEPTFWLYLPTTQNAYGRAMDKTFDLCLDKLGFDGIYWDELAYSGQLAAYGIQDGHSAEPDLATMTVRRKVALVPLYCQGYQLQQAHRVLDAGKILIGNGQPLTETMTRLHFPRFVEAWHPSNLRYAHLYCPLGLGSPDRIDTEDDIAANIRDNLKYGGLWYYYLNWRNVKITHPNIPEHMFPFTPIELHSGYLIGKERIITTHSGLVGWGDASKHRVWVYDDKGYLKEDFQAPTRVIGGKTYTELRLPGAWTAIVERVP